MPINQYEPLTGWKEQQALTEYLKNPGYWTEYKKTEEFEQKIAQYLNVKHCIVVNNGTISLSLALLAMGIKAGDNVIVPNLTMIATPNAVRFIGANPVLCDVTEEGILDFTQAEQLRVLYNAKAVIFVSLNGKSFTSSDWSIIWHWNSLGIGILDDAAQAFGSKTYEGFYCGTRGCDIGSFSFSMPKIITTGQGGCLVTNHDSLAIALRQLKDFGRTGGGNDIHNEFGINCKFTEMQAVLGLAQLEDIEYRTRQKKHIYNTYKTFLPSGILKDIDTSYVVPWFIEISVDNVKSLAEFLKTKDIGTRAIYPPIHTQLVYSNMNNLSFPITTNISNKGLWLPSSLTLTNSQIEYVCETIKEFYGR